MRRLIRTGIRPLSLTLLVIGSANSPDFALQVDQGVMVTAPAPLGTIAEARRIIAAIEAEAAEVRETGRVELGPLKLQSSFSAEGAPIRSAAVRSVGSTDDGGKSWLLRTEESLHAIVVVDGLPAGVYTAWWVIFNRPDLCLTGSLIATHCDAGDISDLEVGDASIYWAAGAIVKSDRIGLFHARTRIGDGSDRAAKGYVAGRGLSYPLRSDVQLVIKYQGPASSDVEGLSRQLVTLPRDCMGTPRKRGLDAFATECPGLAYTLQTPSMSR